MRVYLDTSGLYAVQDRSDQWHASAREFWFDSLLANAKESRVFCSNHVLWETIALLENRLGPDRAYQAGRELLDSSIIEWVDTSPHDFIGRALIEVRSRRISGASFVDHIGFLVMREREIENAFAFDEDFEEAGFRLVPGKVA